MKLLLGCSLSLLKLLGQGSYVGEGSIKLTQWHSSVCGVCGDSRLQGLMWKNHEDRGQTVVDIIRDVGLTQFDRQKAEDRTSGN